MASTYDLKPRFQALLLLPAVVFVRMALNAFDGMLRGSTTKPARSALQPLETGLPSPAWE
jgi:hypothetical protein